MRRKCVWVTVLIFLGYVKSSVIMIIRSAVGAWSVDAVFLTKTVSEIVGRKFSKLCQAMRYYCVNGRVSKHTARAL